MRLLLHCAIAFLLFTPLTQAQVRLPKLISDGMVLQRDVPLKIWGWASPNERIRLNLNEEQYKTQANAAGDWQIELPAHASGGPFSIAIAGKNKITINNVLFGDVWFCSGQSNMVHYMDLHDVAYPKEIAEANNTSIRQFTVPTTTNLQGPATDFRDGTWKVCTPQNVGRFSVVAYFFALQIYEKEKVPIGLINASVGGTPIEAWTSEEGLRDFTDLQATISQNKDTAYVNSFKRVLGNGRDQPVKDKGLTGPKPWYDPTYAPKGWKPIYIPGYWEDQGIKDLNGVVWYRKEVEVPTRMVGKPAKVFLGRIIDADLLYINGQQIGGKTYQYPQRRYPIPAGILKPGKNVFVVKVTNYNGKGGFVPDKPYYFFAGPDTVDLKGTWHYKVGEVFVPRSGPGPRRLVAQNQPAALFNAMVAPALPYALKGVLWYQGESNTGRPESYADLQMAQIQDWRNQWQLGELPFLYVQLPNFMEANYLPSESKWAELRQAQLDALALPNTAMAVGIDLGEWNDIHPGNKKEVGERLALAARHLAYGEELVWSGPLIQSASLENQKVSLSFDHIGSGLMSRDGEDLREFALAGADGRFAWARAEIVGNQVEIWSDDVTRPHYVRYAWADNPDVNFYNQEGLPAAPFQLTLKGAATAPLWHGKKAAVVLTYDDALNVHLDNAIPELEARGLTGTFYISAFSPGSKQRLADWRRAASNGHELGNHTLYHPCDASLPGRSWVTPEKDLSKYSTQQILQEIRMTNVFLEALDGKKERTFAYTCGDTKTSEGSFVAAIETDFVAARGVRGRLNRIGDINLQNVDCYSVNGQSGAEMIEWVKKAKSENALLTILFHGVGGEHSLNVSREAHQQLLDYLQENEDEIWTTTMLQAAKHVKAHQK